MNTADKFLVSFRQTNTATPLATIAKSAGLRLAPARLNQLLFGLAKSGDVELTLNEGVVAGAFVPIKQAKLTRKGIVRAEIASKIGALEQELKRAGKPPQLFCNRCVTATTHTLVGEPATSTLFDAETWSSIRYQLARCSNCEAVHLRAITLTHLGAPGEYAVAVYPARHQRPRPPWAARIEGDFCRGLLQDVYQALDEGLHALAAMGLRSLVVSIFEERTGEEAGFSKALERMVELGMMAEQMRGQLQEALNVGHAATHRRFAPSKDHLDHAMEIAEAWLQSVLTLPAAAAALKSAVPPDPRARRGRA